MSHASLARCSECGAVLARSHRPLTVKQSALYAYLADYVHAKDFAPSFQEIARRFRYSSLSTVHEHLQNLEAKGWIRRRYNEARSIELIPNLGD